MIQTQLKVEPQPQRAQNRRPRTRGLVALLYVIPALIVIVGIIYFGAIYNVWVSTLNWNGVDPDPQSVGLGNYRDILGDPIFWGALRNIAVFGILTILIQMVAGLVLALVLGGPIWGRGVYKALVFIPVVLAPAAVSTAFRQFYRPDGQINEVFGLFGLDFLQRAWIADPDVALYALIAVNIFQWTGFSFILYQAALSQIDTQTLEAAQIDGANWFRTIRDVVIPQLRSTHITLALTGVIGSLKTFDIVFLITGGGPGRATEFLTTYIYKQSITQFHVGYGGALSVVLMILALMLTVVQTRIYKFGKET